ncbi:odorant receptor 13a [Calliopsis andreniformis]|uniref:odorant receptor 13a n=1 Tax=Calliopsis andreniformis TaxID=337506 RepID=UPI003FCE3A37
MLNTCELLWSALNPNEKKIVESYAKKTSRLTLYYLSTCIVTVLVYCMAVLLVSSTQNNLSDINDDSKNATNASLNLERHLPYVFFVEIQETPWYELVFVFEIVCMMNVGIACVGTDTLGVLFTLIACGHFDVIKSRMEGVTVEVETTSGRRWLSHSPSANIATAEAPSKEQIDSFRVCVVHHQILLGLCEELQDLTSMQLLVQLLGSTYNISLAGFKLVGDDPGKFKFIMQLLVLLFQLFMCNWPADVLSTKSEAACQAAYSAPWYQYPSWLRKPVNLMLVRTQRPARLTAGKYIVLSLETFKAMISSAVSFFTVVKSMN